MIERISMIACLIAAMTFTVGVQAALSGADSNKGAAGNAVGNQDKVRVIEQIMAVSGIDEMIKQIPDAVAMGFDQQPPPVNQPKFERYREAFLGAFDSSAIRSKFVQRLDGRYEEGRFTEMLALLNTPLARKMAALEREAMTPQAQQGMMRMGNVIMGQAPPRRLALAQRIDEAWKSSENMVAMQIMMAKAMMEGRSRLTAPEQRVPEKQMADMLEQIRMQSIYPARQFALLIALYAYRSVSDGELEEYVELLELGIARWYTALINDIWLEVYKDIARDASDRASKVLMENKAL